MQKDFSTNLSAEEAVLGAILRDNTALVQILGAGLSASHFSEPLYQAIFTEMERRIGSGQIVSLVTLRDGLPQKLGDGRTISQVLAHIQTQAAPSQDAAEIAQLVAILAAKRSFLQAASKLANANEKNTAPDEAIRVFNEDVDTIRLGLVKTSMRRTGASLKETLEETVKQVDAVVQGTTNLFSIPTGVISLDDILGGGFHPGTLVICAGRPGMGKSVVGVSLARQIAAKKKFGVGFFSLEMPELDIGSRILTDAAHTYEDPILYSDLTKQDPLLSENHHERILLAQRDIQDFPIEFDYSNFITVSELGAKARAMAVKIQIAHGLPMGIIIIDYLKFLKASDRYKGHRVYELGEITAALKALARDLNVCVFLLAQLNREVEKTEDKRPTLSHLRDSGDLEADSDVVLFLYRQHYYLIRDEKAIKESFSALENDIEIDIAKQRMGPTGRIKLYCNMGASAIRDRDNPLPPEEVF